MKAAFTLSQSKTKSLTALFLAMVLMLLAPSMMRGQTVTVCDGTATNSYVPMYTYYCDYSFTSEYIIPQSQLSNLPSGSAIRHYIVPKFRCCMGSQEPDYKTHQHHNDILLIIWITRQFRHNSLHQLFI